MSAIFSLAAILRVIWIALVVLYVVLACWALLSVVEFYSLKKEFDGLNENEKQKYSAFRRLDFDFFSSRGTKQDGILGVVNFFSLVFGAIFVFPIRFCLLLLCGISTILWLQFFSSACTLNVTADNLNKANPVIHNRRIQHTEDRAVMYRSILSFVMGLHSRTLLCLLGVWTVREYSVADDLTGSVSENSVIEGLPSDFDPKAPRCIVANHQSMADTLYFILKAFPAFLARASTERDLLSGPCAKALNCVFINRSSAEHRQTAIEIIGQRQEELWKLSVQSFLGFSKTPSSSLAESSENKENINSKNINYDNNNQQQMFPMVSPELSSFIALESSDGFQQKEFLIKNVNNNKDAYCIGPSSLVPRPMFHKNIPPLIIFPEGTTSSGRSILPFKRGAFLGLKPVTPVVLIYRFRGVSISYDVLKIGWWLPLVLSSIHPVTLEAYWLREVLPPSPLSGGPFESSSSSFSDNLNFNFSSSNSGDRVQQFSVDVHSRMSRILKARSPQTTESGPSQNWTGGLRFKQDLLVRLNRPRIRPNTINSFDETGQSRNIS